MKVQLALTSRTDRMLRQSMQRHYSAPKGFVGRNLCFAIRHKRIYYGHIVAGSAVRHLPGRHEFLNTDESMLNNIINNIFFHCEPLQGPYPFRNFTTHVVKCFEKVAPIYWEEVYGDKVVGFETLVEEPRPGTLYKRAGWTKVGKTKGFTCKRTGGEGTDSWTGRRVWDTENLRPKFVFCKRRAE